MDHLSHSTTICTSTYQTLPAYGHPPYDPAMSGQNILGVPETMNSCYVPDSIMPSFVLPELRLEENQMRAQFEAQLEKNTVEINQMQTQFKAQKELYETQINLFKTNGTSAITATLTNFARRG